MEAIHWAAWPLLVLFMESVRIAAFVFILWFLIGFIITYRFVERFRNQNCVSSSGTKTSAVRLEILVPHAIVSFSNVFTYLAKGQVQMCRDTFSASKIRFLLKFWSALSEPLLASVITLKMSVLVEKLFVSITFGAQDDQQRDRECALCPGDLLNSGVCCRLFCGHFFHQVILMRHAIHYWLLYPLWSNLLTNTVGLYRGFIAWMATEMPMLLATISLCAT
jgi:hypothetical protein